MVSWNLNTFHFGGDQTSHAHYLTFGEPGFCRDSFRGLNQPLRESGSSIDSVILNAKCLKILASPWNVSASHSASWYNICFTRYVGWPINISYCLISNSDIYHISDNLQLVPGTPNNCFFNGCLMKHPFFHGKDFGSSSN